MMGNKRLHARNSNAQGEGCEAAETLRESEETKSTVSDTDLCRTHRANIGLSKQPGLCCAVLSALKPWLALPIAPQRDTGRSAGFRWTCRWTVAYM